MRPVVVEEKVVLQGPLFQIKKKKLLFGKKKKIHYNVFRLPTVIVFPLTKDNELYLIEEYRYLHNKVQVEAIAGHVDENESPLKAAARELKEEAGIEAEQLEEFARLEGSGSVVRSTSYFYLAKGLEIGKQEMEEDEDITLIKISLSEAVSNVIQGKIRNSAAAFGILMLDRMKRDKTL